MTVRGTQDVRFVVRPLLEWPGTLLTDTERSSNPFSASWSMTETMLRRETAMLGGEELVVQMAIDDSDIRLDGWVRAAARPKHPGVTVVLPDSNEGRISFSTDRYRGGSVHRHGRSFHMPGWQVNLRAIALSMEALRAADRHGLMKGRQYAGFRELGSGAPLNSTPLNNRMMTIEEAARFLATHAGSPYGADVNYVLEHLPVLHRRAAKQLHPDNGGDTADFNILQEAVDLLKTLTHD